jgi:hypothetical protein
MVELVVMPAKRVMVELVDLELGEMVVLLAQVVDPVQVDRQEAAVVVLQVLELQVVAPMAAAEDTHQDHLVFPNLVRDLVVLNHRAVKEVQVGKLEILVVHHQVVEEDGVNLAVIPVLVAEEAVVVLAVMVK